MCVAGGGGEDTRMANPFSSVKQESAASNSLPSSAVRPDLGAETASTLTHPSRRCIAATGSAACVYSNAMASPIPSTRNQGMLRQ